MFPGILLDVLFPIECLGCRREGSYCCAQCLARIPRLTNSACPFCSRRSTIGTTCRGCHSDHSLDGVFAAAPYDHPFVQRTIKAMKYQSIDTLASPLGELLASSVRSVPELFRWFVDQAFILVPIPLHKHRLRERGFNQAERLAEIVRRQLGFPLRSDLLIRVRDTTPQVELKQRARQSNLEGAFSVARQAGAPRNPVTREITASESWSFTKIPKCVMLIDDLATTGATLDEAARVLKTAGVKRVWGLVLARG